MRRIVLSGMMIGLLAAANAHAQQRPLVTEDPETIGSGLVLLEGGVDHLREIFYPVSGLTGNLLRLPTLGVSFGISPIAEIQIDGGLYNRLTVTDREDAPLSSILDFTGDRTTSIEDLVIGTKIRVLSETAGRPAVGFRFATKLPNASNESGLGLDTTDFYASLLIGKTVQSIRVVGNAGVGVLADPTEGGRQNDVLTYGLSLARAVRQGLEVVGEVNGHLDVRDGDPPPGTDTRGAMRLGGRFTKGTVRVDAGLIVGMTSRDPSIGFTAGLTWVFRGFTIP
ncbi:MAG TPA: hypothetical protein VJ813_16430 [Vicinamibacterales bacterium]|nr:hypothetical protein [Vicinamibacterales bacterium]